MIRRIWCPNRLEIWLLLAFALAGSPASAAVEIRFYSKELGTSFPHAFVELEGVNDRTGERIHASYGFTATTISPAILMGSVKGAVMPVSKEYLRNSNRHFALSMTADDYDHVAAKISEWQNAKQPSYNLNLRNCVHFVAELAAAIGMRADTPKGLMKKPRSFLQSVAAANRSLLQARGAPLERADAVEPPGY